MIMVEWKKLGEISTVQRGKRLTKKLLSNDEVYPVFHGGIEPLGFYKEYNRLENTVMIINVGASAGSVGFSNQKFWSSDGCFCISHNNIINSKYLYFFLLGKVFYLQSQVRYAGIPTLDASAVERISIPIPSLPEQERIVEILDTFTSSIENLKEQIAQRRKQFEYYRDQLHDIEGKEGVEMKTLGEMCFIKTGNKPKFIFDIGKYRYINAGTSESGYTDETNCDANVVTTPSRGQGGIGFIAFQPVDFWLGPLCYQIRSIKDEVISNKYLYYYLSEHNDEILKYKNEGGTPAVNAADLKKIPILFPSPSEQFRIVSILDTFEASIANLEAQLEMRQKQYEFYRNQLLTF